MDAQELLVHDGRQGQTTERLHAGVIYPLRILVTAYEPRLSEIQLTCRVVTHILA